MKVTIIMAMSLNGIIALEDGSEEFLSDAGGSLISKLAVQRGSLIWGRRTDERFQTHYSDEAKKELESIPKVVVTTDPEYPVAGGYSLASSPQAALKLLINLGLTKTAVVGGSTLNTAFLRAGLVDEIVINFEPIVVGKGLPLFAPNEFEVPVQLQSAERVNKGELLVTYKVVK